ncbi:MAG: MraY family glycosyltransferase [Patescibacteria group bacterium]|nr:MraY family glycosyltransferase [Patescibacteria group bacterium]MDD5715352.1 MraY family glycosyltransferase [Patescibacteria group bacterium]
MGNYLSVKYYIIPFIATAIVAAVLTYVIRKLALRWQIVDRPGDSPERKIQKQPVPLLGGLAIFFSMALVTLGYALFSDRLLGGYMQLKYLIGIGVAGLVLMLGGFLDDRKGLKPSRQILWPLLATLITIGAGIGITYITNPLGGTINLDAIRIHVLTIGGVPYFFILFADLFAIIWLMGMMYTTKFLDGLDGLVTGITTIGSIVLFFLSIHQEVAQPETALLAVILAGACFGFLFFNFHPARIFLGEGGSLFTGYMLGVLAIISGAKIATALLIMGIPILDVAWVIGRRLFFEKKSPFSTADRKHLHFRLLDIGFTHRKAVLFLYGVSILCGSLALVLEGSEKMFALIAVGGGMVVLASIIVLVYRRRIRQASPDNATIKQ